MISPMLKYQFLVFYQENDELLRQLKSAGVVHIKRVKRQEDEASLALKRKAGILKQSSALFERVVPEQELNDIPLLDDFQLDQLPALLQELEDMQKQLARLEEERFHYRYFGEYSPDKLREIQEHGMFWHLFSVGLGKINTQWSKDHALEHLFDTGRKSYFVILSSDPQAPRIKAQPEQFPARSMLELEREIGDMEYRRSRILQTLYVLRESIRRNLQEEQKQTEDQLQDRIAETQMVTMGFGKVTYLQGWVPEDQSANVERILDEAGIYSEHTRPVPQDGPPILLRNEKTSRLFEPIARLFDMPNYLELDLTPFFAPFFLLFFGLCLGDGGYGLLMFLVLLAVRRKIPDAYVSLWKLALLLEAGAIFMGIASGTFFGINLLEAPWPWLARFRKVMLTPDQLFQVSLGLGAVQIIFGLLLRAWNQKRQFGWQYSISPIGWILLLIGLGTAYATGFSPVLQVLCGVGAGLVIFFSDPKAGLAGRLGKGLWDLYGITGFFGDLLSYIRLFALGLAGSILGFVVNDISLSILHSNPILGPVFFVVMLLVGHTLNIFIASLGAFVHPMRLTFVEFYKNAGFSGGGEPYKPLTTLHESAPTSSN